MKKFFAIVLCLCALVSVCSAFAPKEETSTGTVAVLSKKSKPDVRDGAPSEGIVLL